MDAAWGAARQGPAQRSGSSSRHKGRAQEDFTVGLYALWTVRHSEHHDELLRWATALGEDAVLTLGNARDCEVLRRLAVAPPRDVNDAAMLVVLAAERARSKESTAALIQGLARCRALSEAMQLPALLHLARVFSTGVPRSLEEVSSALAPGGAASGGFSASEASGSFGARQEAPAPATATTVPPSVQPSITTPPVPMSQPLAAVTSGAGGADAAGMAAVPHPSPAPVPSRAPAVHAAQLAAEEEEDAGLPLPASLMDMASSKRAPHLPAEDRASAGTQSLRALTQLMQRAVAKPSRPPLLALLAEGLARPGRGVLTARLNQTPVSADLTTPGFLVHGQQAYGSLEELEAALREQSGLPASAVLTDTRLHGQPIEEVVQGLRSSLADRAPDLLSGSRTVTSQWFPPKPETLCLPVRDAPPPPKPPTRSVPPHLRLGAGQTVVRTERPPRRARTAALAIVQGSRKRGRDEEGQRGEAEPARAPQSVPPPPSASSRRSGKRSRRASRSGGGKSRRGNGGGGGGGGAAGAAGEDSGLSFAARVGLGDKPLSTVLEKACIAAIEALEGAAQGTRYDTWTKEALRLCTTVDPPPSLPVTPAITLDKVLSVDDRALIRACSGFRGLLEAVEAVVGEGARPKVDDSASRACCCHLRTALSEGGGGAATSKSAATSAGTGAAAASGVSSQLPGASQAVQRALLHFPSLMPLALGQGSARLGAQARQVLAASLERAPLPRELSELDAGRGMVQAIARGISRPQWGLVGGGGTGPGQPLARQALPGPDQAGTSLSTHLATLFPASPTNRARWGDAALPSLGLDDLLALHAQTHAGELRGFATDALLANAAAHVAAARVCAAHGIGDAQTLRWIAFLGHTPGQKPPALSAQAHAAMILSLQWSVTGLGSIEPSGIAASDGGPSWAMHSTAGQRLRLTRLPTSVFGHAASGRLAPGAGAGLAHLPLLHDALIVADEAPVPVPAAALAGWSPVHPEAQGEEEGEGADSAPPLANLAHPLELVEDAPPGSERLAPGIGAKALEATENCAHSVPALAQGLEEPSKAAGTALTEVLRLTPFAGLLRAGLQGAGEPPSLGGQAACSAREVGSFPRPLVDDVRVAWDAVDGAPGSASVTTSHLSRSRRTQYSMSRLRMGGRTVKTAMRYAEVLMRGPNRLDPLTLVECEVYQTEEERLSREVWEGEWGPTAGESTEGSAAAPSATGEGTEGSAAAPSATGEGTEGSAADAAAPSATGDSVENDPSPTAPSSGEGTRRGRDSASVPRSEGPPAPPPTPAAEPREGPAATTEADSGGEGAQSVVSALSPLPPAADVPAAGSPSTAPAASAAEGVPVSVEPGVASEAETVGDGQPGVGGSDAGPVEGGQAPPVAEPPREDQPPAPAPVSAMDEEEEEEEGGVGEGGSRAEATETGSQRSRLEERLNRQLGRGAVEHALRGGDQARFIEQPFRVVVEPHVHILVDAHAHMATCEIIGLLAGHVDEAAGEVRVVRAVPTRSLTLAEDATVNVEMDPTDSVAGADMASLHGLSIVGWYHSHPTFQVDPSITDVRMQANQSCMYGTPLFLGLIVGPYDAALQDTTSWFRYFHVRDPTDDSLVSTAPHRTSRTAHAGVLEPFELIATLRRYQSRDRDGGSREVASREVAEVASLSRAALRASRARRGLRIRALCERAADAQGAAARSRRQLDMERAQRRQSVTRIRNVAAEAAREVLAQALPEPAPAQGNKQQPLGQPQQLQPQPHPYQQQLQQQQQHLQQQQSQPQPHTQQLHPSHPQHTQQPSLHPLGSEGLAPAPFADGGASPVRRSGRARRSTPRAEEGLKEAPSAAEAGPPAAAEVPAATAAAAAQTSAELDPAEARRAAQKEVAYLAGVRVLDRATSRFDAEMGVRESVVKAEEARAAMLAAAAHEARAREQRRRAGEALIARYGTAVAPLVAQLVDLTEFYRAYPLRVDWRETWRPGITRMDKLEGSLRPHVAHLPLTAASREAFVKDVVGYICLSWVPPPRRENRGEGNGGRASSKSKKRK